MFGAFVGRPIDAYEDGPVDQIFGPSLAQITLKSLEQESKIKKDLLFLFLIVMSFLQNCAKM